MYVVGGWAVDYLCIHYFILTAELIFTCLSKISVEQKVSESDDIYVIYIRMFYNTICGTLFFVCLMVCGSLSANLSAYI